MITKRAYETLEYYELALQELKNSCFFSDNKTWRLRWLTCICLLKTAGEVGRKEAEKVPVPEFTRCLQQQWKENPISQTLKNYRDNLVHEFKFNETSLQLITTEDDRALSTGQICMDDDKSVWEFLDEAYQWTKDYLDNINSHTPS